MAKASLMPVQSLVNEETKSFNLGDVSAWAKQRLGFAAKFGPSAVLEEQAAIRADLKFMANEHGLVNLGAALSLVGVIVGVILSISVLAALAPTFFSSVKNLTLAFASPDTGSSLADTILGIIAFIIPLVLVFSLVGLVFVISRKMKGNLGY